MSEAQSLAQKVRSLTEDLKEHKEANDYWVSEAKRLTAESARFRAALEVIKDQSYEPARDTEHEDWSYTLAASRIARAALEADDHGK